MAEAAPWDAPQQPEAPPWGAPSSQQSNFEAAKAELNLNPQEQALYQRHLTNLTGSGGVDNPDGSRSSLYQMSFEQEGKTYNIPTVYDGKILKPDAAIARARQEGLNKFPSYGSEEEAESRYEKMHSYMERDTAAYLQNRQQGDAAEPQGLLAQGVGMLGTSEGRSQLMTGVAKLPMDVLKGTLDWFETPGKAAKEGLTPAEEIGFGFNTALATVGSKSIPRGPVEPVLQVAKEFQEGIVAPAAQRLDSYARTGDPNGVRLEPPISETKPTPIRPVEGSPFAGVPTTVAAKTGVPEVDSVLNSPVTNSVINNPVIDRSHDVPYMAGGSVPMNDPTVYIDRHVPKEQRVNANQEEYEALQKRGRDYSANAAEAAAMGDRDLAHKYAGMAADIRNQLLDWPEITFDPAEPWSVHENVEQHTMEILTKPDNEVHWYQGVNPGRSVSHGIGQPQTSEYWTTDLDKAKVYAGPNGFIRVARESSLPPEAMARRSGDITTSLKLGEGGKPATIQQVPTIAELPRSEIDANISKLHQLMSDAEAYRVAHFEFAEPAEQAWYRAHGIDQEAAEKEQASWLPRIQHENPENPPPNLYKKPYPHADVKDAEHESVEEAPPTAEEKQRAFDIIRNAPELQPKSAQPMLQQARELGVIGPERPPVNQMTPKEAADAVVPPKPPSPAGGGGQPKQSAWRQRLNTSLDRLGISSEAKALIDDVVDRNAEYQGVRQGDLRPAQIETMAEAFGMDPSNIDPVRTGLMVKTNAQLQNAVELMTTLNGKVEEIAKRIAEKEGTDDADDIVELSKLRIQRRLIAENSVVPFIAVRAEGSRALTTVKNLYAAAEGNGIGQFLKDTEGMDTDDVRRLAREIATSPGGAARALGKMDDMKKDGPIYWMWKQGLISGWLTHTKYLAANTTYQAMERGAVTPIASVIGKVIGKEGDRVNMADALAGVSGLMNAIPDAFTQGKKAFRNNAIPALESEKKLYAAAVERNKELVAAGEAPEKIPTMLSRAIEQGDLPRPGPSSGVWGKYLPQSIIDQLAKLETPLSVPGRSAGFIHTVFRNLGEGATLAEEASRKAASEGLSPISQEYWDRVSYHMDNADEKMLQNSVQDAWKGTFMSELGKGGKLIAGAIRQDPILKWIFPFTHIPVNLMKATLEYTPLAPLGKEWRDSLMGHNGGVAQQKALARVTIGSAVMTYFANKYMQGQATGEYPIDPKVRAQWKLEGKEPNSLLVGDSWYSVNKFGPFGDLAQIGANIGAVAHAYMESREQHDDIDVSLTKAAGLGVLAAANLVSDEVGMLTLQNGFEVLSDQSPTHDKLTTFAGMQASSLIPFSSAISQTASVTDPYMRQIKGILGALEYRIPGLRQSLPAKRDPLYGEPIANPQYGNIIRQRQANVDPVKMELDRLSQATGWKPAAPKNLVGKIKLTPDQYDRYEATAGPLVKQMLSADVNSQRYQSLPDAAKTERVKGIIEFARARARMALQMDAPHLIRQGIDNRTRQITGDVSTGAPQ